MQVKGVKRKRSQFTNLRIFQHTSNLKQPRMKPFLWPIFFFIIQHVKARVIPCPHQPPTRGDNTISVAHLELPKLCYHPRMNPSYTPQYNIRLLIENKLFTIKFNSVLKIYFFEKLRVIQRLFLIFSLEICSSKTSYWKRFVWL